MWSSRAELKDPPSHHGHLSKAAGARTSRGATPGAFFCVRVAPQLTPRCAGCARSIGTVPARKLLKGLM